MCQTYELIYVVLGARENDCETGLLRHFLSKFLFLLTKWPQTSSVQCDMMKSRSILNETPLPVHYKHLGYKCFSNPRSAIHFQDVVDTNPINIQPFPDHYRISGLYHEGLTHCGQVTPYGDRDLGWHWLRKWLGAGQHQAITWTNIDPLPSIQ